MLAKKRFHGKVKLHLNNTNINIIISTIKNNNSQCSFEPTVALKERIKLTL